MNVQQALTLLKNYSGKTLKFTTNNKGGVGNYIEHILGIKPGTSNIDFIDGELKTIPLSTTGGVKETVALSMINNSHLDENLLKSKYYLKMKKTIFLPFVAVGDKLTIYNPLLIDLEKEENKNILDQLIIDYNEIRKHTLEKTIQSNIGKIIQSRTKGPGGNIKTRAFYYKKLFLESLLNINSGEYNIKDYSLMDKVEPFIKYPGGKTQLMGDIVEKAQLVPCVETYIEPFIGSGSVLMGLINAGILTKTTKIYISDLNSAIIGMFEVIKQRPDEFINSIENELVKFSAVTKEGKQDVYTKCRELYNSTQDKFIKSTLFMVLNITCFNGLHRVNSNGVFNVPIGRNANGSEFALTETKKKNIRLFSNILNTYDITMSVRDYFESTVDITSPQTTLMYLDPPYVPVCKTSFTGYMGKFDHNRFFNFVKRLPCYTIVSNSNTLESVIGLIHMKLTRINIRRMIGSNSRNMCNEILADNFQNFPREIVLPHFTPEDIEIMENWLASL
ncbi:DNA adenine methylase [Pacmanvirus S19]|nr:DNA adenine methylase [Pacmanvirus S19]